MSEKKENCILDGMNLIAKYEPGADMHARHDQICFGSYRPDLMKNEEREQMERWDWFEHEESWSHFC